MIEQKVREILGSDLRIIERDDGLFDLGGSLSWSPGDTAVRLNGYFGADDLEAIAWWVRTVNKRRAYE